MGPVGIIVADPFCERGPQFQASLERMQIDALVLQAAPQPLDEHIVHPPAAAVHRDPYPRRLQHAGEQAQRDAAQAAAVRQSGAGSALGVITNLQQYVASLSTSDASAGTAEDRMLAARRQFDAVYGSAQAGNAISLQAFLFATAQFTLGLA